MVTYVKTLGVYTSEGDQWHRGAVALRLIQSGMQQRRTQRHQCPLHEIAEITEKMTTTKTTTKACSNSFQDIEMFR